MRTFMKTGFLFYMLRWPSRLGRQTHRVFVVSSERRHLGYLEIAGSIPARSILFPVQSCSGPDGRALLHRGSPAPGIPSPLSGGRRP